MKTRNRITKIVACLGLVVALAQVSQAATNYYLDKLVVNAFGSTASATSAIDNSIKCILFSGGEVVIGQCFGNSVSAQIGFLNEYFQAIPTNTATITPTLIATMTPTPTISATSTISATTTSTPTITPTMTQTPYVTSTPTASPTVTATSKPNGYDEQRLKVYHSQINPLNHEKAIIRWYQFKEAGTTIRIYNLLGNCVATLADDKQYAAGQIQEIIWQGTMANGNCAASGIYMVYIQSGDYKEWTKIAVVK